jgi:hypothetical protein
MSEEVVNHPTKSGKNTILHGNWSQKPRPANRVIVRNIDGLARTFLNKYTIIR